MPDPNDPSRRVFLAGLAAAGAGLLARPARSGEPVSTAQAAAALPGSPLPKAYVNFVINVQNFRYLDSSAEVVSELCDIFRKNGVQGDFYLTGPMAELYQASHPAVIEKLKGQGICYHSRPPHPIFTGFEGPLKGLSGDALLARLTEYETQSLDLSTGQLRADQPGGFALVTSLLGKAPSTVAVPTTDPTLKTAGCRLYKQMGAKATVWFHKPQNLGDNPYQFKNDLLVRPMDLAIYEWQAKGEAKETLWWNRFKEGSPSAEGFPKTQMERQIGQWTGRRPPFVTSQIHENNFARRGRDPWVNTFWADPNKNVARSGPYDLNATDPSTARSVGEQKRIMAAYAEMVEHCATNYRVVTMADVCTMAGI